jgi:hypothetical protein
LDEKRFTNNQAHSDSFVGPLNVAAPNEPETLLALLELNEQIVNDHQKESPRAQSVDGASS